MSDEEIYSYISDQDEDPVVEVLVNPRHVVSVPRDHGGQKMRVCQYYVHGLFNGEYDQDYAPIDHYIEQETAEMKAQLEAMIDEARTEAKEKIATAEQIQELIG